MSVKQARMSHDSGAADESVSTYVINKLAGKNRIEKIMLKRQHSQFRRLQGPSLSLWSHAGLI